MSSGFEVAANTLLQQARRENAATADTLKIIVDEIRRIGNIVDPPPVILGKPHTPTAAQTPDVITASYRFTPYNLILEWVPPSNETFYYEIRKGTVWATAPRVLVTNNFLALLDPITTGTHHYLIKAINSQGTYSINAYLLEVVLPPIGALSISNTTISNNVMLFWTTPTSIFAIDYYIVERFDVVIGTIRGTFTSYNETAGGLITFSVTPVDIAGNHGPRVSTDIPVPPPDDFDLQGILNARWDGIFVNSAAIDINGELVLFAPIELENTWEEHFTIYGFNSPQGQIDAGYPIYIQPVPNFASYKEVFDFGVVFPSTIVNITWTYVIIVGNMTVGVSSRVSADGISWGAPVSGQTVFAQNIRFIEVTLNFTGDGTFTSFAAIADMSVSLSVKQEIDSGTIFAVASDINGTVAVFNKSFKDVNSITVATKSVEQPFTVIHDFNDIPNPVNFTIYVYDSEGNRVSERVDWKARGII